MLAEITLMDTFLFWVYTFIIFVLTILAFFLVASIIGGISELINKRRKKNNKYISETRDSLTLEEYKDKIV